MIVDVSWYFHNALHTVPSTIQSTIGVLIPLITQQPSEVDTTIIAVLQMRKLGHREVKQHAQGHTANIVDSRAGISNQTICLQGYSAFLISLALSFTQPLLRLWDVILAE